ncbi:type II toxin-antitoxin system prevent-host-death family antitoxin [Acidiferrobacter thiooxydans]|jgi:prevent-host-death family protein|uniref:type II toxin-antitoxin system Phd/YefM family antitoxin n=1 Tax=Acidiferrobacter TaxID=986106 RepID=UPI0009FCF230|nr:MULTISPECIES: type II toxin-antitoxin system prevent-host-death family antitoxin [Acidiferrobacter]AWP24897.1 type II toxin-antitoxin system prevent-host-death family antitoxin [Acidiferrobacter sp. SPIII_3]MDA8119760.1 type II toxin-antitoxin system prevent-host-death family antitoxin [Gammaproteobacteria bacterium]MDA8190582.1 type II toxin-antitoxin system prevent-host-death family antitoxin [Gammaproteobacteria bacterium]UEN99240.1 type II toxin-antitoxin system prevent-host-death family
MEISAYEAKTTLPALLKRVIAGETITITEYGTPVARITPMTATAGHDQEAAIEALKHFARGCTTGGAGVCAMIEEGRR